MAAFRTRCAHMAKEMCTTPRSEDAWETWTRPRTDLALAGVGHALRATMHAEITA